MRLLLLFASVLLAVDATGQTAADGYWEGSLNYLEADLAIRLHVEPSGDSVRATLDIPDLLMAWEQIPARESGDRVEITLPFGLGTMGIETTGDNVRTVKPLGSDSLSLRLARSGPPPYHREEVTFMSGGTTLAGTVVLPEGDGPHPGIVLVHGSGRLGRHSWGYRSWADMLAREGLAVLYYDKRGVGESGGDFGADLEQLASDARAAVNYLRSRPETDTARVGLHGWSQGAWLAEQVAADEGDIPFLILVSGAADTPRDQEMQRVRYGMRLDGHPEEAIEDALAYLGLYFYVARTGHGWTTLQAAVADATASDWGNYVNQPEVPDDLDWWRANHDVQPASLVDSLDLPALLLYGAADPVTPPVENAEKLKSLFAAPDRVTVHVFPRADHRLEVSSGVDNDGAWQWPRIAPGALDAVRTWLSEESIVERSDATRRGESIVPVGLFIGAMEEGARVFTPIRLLPFEHPEAEGHEFPNALQLHRNEYEALVRLGEQVGLKLAATLLRYPKRPTDEWSYDGFAEWPVELLDSAPVHHVTASRATIPGLRAAVFKSGRAVAFIVDTRGLTLEERGLERPTTMGLDLTREGFLSGLQALVDDSRAGKNFVVIVDP